jgi:hypothetical protein
MENRRDLSRFMSYVELSDGCWDWTGAALPRGYGRFYFRGKPRYAHRVAVELFTCQQVPDDAVVMHSCDRPCCVNPAHLSVGTQIENMRDASTKGRIVRLQDWRGARNPKAKLSAGQTDEVRRRARSGETTRSLAAEFGITTVRVGQIRRSA